MEIVTYGLGEKYTCTLFPTGAEAKRVFDDAQAMLTKIVEQNLLQAHGVVAIFPAHSEGDDIVVLSEDRGTKLGVLYGLRQQVLWY